MANNPRVMENLKNFEKGKSGNPFGRPPKLLSSILSELKEAGFERVGVANLVEAYEFLLGMTEENIKQVSSHKDNPMILRIVAKAMSSRRGIEMLEKMLDRAHGKAKQQIDVSSLGKSITPKAPVIVKQYITQTTDK